MLIDWFTVGAQVLNFLVLVWLLKRFLYKPILNAIAVREKRIADGLADAAAKQAAAGKERDALQAKNAAFDTERGALLAKATEDAKSERERLMAEAHKVGDELRAKQAGALESDRLRLGKEITRLTGEEVFAITRKTLADLATSSLEERMGEVFTRRLRELDAEAKAALGAALSSSSEPALVRSGFALPDAQKAAIQNVLNETYSAEVRLLFETAPDGLCGIELTAGGQKLAWNIAGYLGALEQKLAALLDTQGAQAVAAAPKPEPVKTPAAIPQARAA